MSGYIDVKDITYDPGVATPNDRAMVVDAPSGNTRLLPLVSLVDARVQQPLGIQDIPYAAAITPTPTVAQPVVRVGVLTGNLTINAVATPGTPQTWRLLLRQDATGGRTVSFNAQFYQLPVIPVNTGPNEQTIIDFFWDGSNFIS